MGPARPAWSRLLGRLLLALVFLAAVFLRLARVPRPRFEARSRHAGGQAVVGRVVAGPRRQVLGWALLCRGREALARRGPRAFERVAGDPDHVAVLDASGRHARVGLLRVRDCAAGWLPVDGPVHALTLGAGQLRVAGPRGEQVFPLAQAGLRPAGP